LAPLGPDRSYRRQQFLEGFALHHGDVAIVMKKNFVATKLTGDDPPTAAENLNLLLTLNADAKPEALHGSNRIINVANCVIATNDNDGGGEYESRADSRQ
jgi:hypothetical protein